MAAARLMVGATMGELRSEGLLPAHEFDPTADPGFVAVKEVVLPFNRFPEADAVLGPEMRSTGEVMAIDSTPGMAFVKAQLAAGTRLPAEGAVFMSMADRDKPVGLQAARILHELGYRLLATAGTAQFLRDGGVPVAVEVAKLREDAPSDNPNAVQLITDGEVHLVVNSPHGRGPRADGEHIRSAAGRAGLPLLTTGAAALAAANGLRDLRDLRPSVRSLQEYHPKTSDA